MPNKLTNLDKVNIRIDLIELEKAILDETTINFVKWSKDIRLIRREIKKIMERMVWDRRFPIDEKRSKIIVKRLPNNQIQIDIWMRGKTLAREFDGRIALYIIKEEMAKENEFIEED